ncbi:hypothetical protein BKA58DRAFT_464762 [Alternaria rosae]|uniref:uncharacterized protein n=1 Tax=Alternaria rosae TaxID=1187941 RepID=UPI001E8DCE08|nr:uncharacterized protein BKA58DRAFT_464762 [Alternaria rosae]KAH6882854.1 hypothetical protein BKA58DRAFT_464762 [Alternaria rosae]
MLLRKKYILGDFTKYGVGKLGLQFAAVADMDHYEFAEKVYLDERKNTHRCHMVRVGHYSFKSGGPPVWAEATGERIRYYSGAGVQVTPLVHNVHSSKVYYDPPFSHIGGGLDYSSVKPGMSSERRLERAIVEAVVNFSFLKSGRLEQVSDMVNLDILSSFRQACRNFGLYQRSRDNADNADYHRSLGNGPSTPVSSRRLCPFVAPPSTERNGQLAVCDGNLGSLVLRKRQFAGLNDDLTGDLQRDSNKRPRLLEDSINRDAQMHAQIEREVWNLRAQLVEQEAKTSAAKDRLMREKTKRREAQAERDACKEEYKTQQALSESATEQIKQEEGKKDWKAMLSAQEKKTQDYKLKYIAMKEEKAEWEAQKQEMRGTIVTLASKVTSQRAHNRIANAGHMRKREEKTILHKEAIKVLSTELAKEKEARVFWQRTWHSSLPGSSRNRPLPPSSPTAPRNQNSSMEIIRAPLDHRRTKPHQSTPGLRETVPLPQGMRR